MFQVPLLTTTLDLSEETPSTKGGLKFNMAGFGVQYVMITGHKTTLRLFAECWVSFPVRKSVHY